jgi:hypothetical protein
LIKENKTFLVGSTLVIAAAGAYYYFTRTQEEEIQVEVKERKEQNTKSEDLEIPKEESTDVPLNLKKFDAK